MKKKLVIAILPFLLLGAPCRCPGGTPDEARADYEKLTERYLETYRSYLRARLKNAPDLDEQRRAYEIAYTDYLNTLRMKGQKGESNPAISAEVASSSTSVAVTASPAATTVAPPDIQPASSAATSSTASAASTASDATPPTQLQPIASAPVTDKPASGSTGEPTVATPSEPTSR